MDYKTIEKRALLTSHQYTLEDNWIMANSWNRPFLILIGNISDREVELSKHIEMAQTAVHPIIIHSIDKDHLEASP